MAQYMTPMGPTKLHVMPLFEIGPLEPRFSEWLVFEGAENPSLWFCIVFGCLGGNSTRICMQQHQDQLSDVDGTVRQRNLGAQPSIHVH